MNPEILEKLEGIEKNLKEAAYSLSKAYMDFTILRKLLKKEPPEPTPPKTPGRVIQLITTRTDKDVA